MIPYIDFYVGDLILNKLSNVYLLIKSNEYKDKNLSKLCILKFDSYYMNTYHTLRDVEFPYYDYEKYNEDIFFKISSEQEKEDIISKFTTAQVFK